MKWVAIESLDDKTLRILAKERALVRMTTGRIVTLVSWPGYQRSHKGRQCRLQTMSGARFTVHCKEIEAIAVDP